MEVPESIAESTQTLFQTDPRVLAVFLLGSAARCELRPDSDIDLALMLYPGTTLDPLERTEIAGRLAYILMRPVDMGEISGKNLVYSREALLTGITVHVKDTDKMNLIRANLLGQYLQFNEDRKEVLDAYQTG